MREHWWRGVGLSLLTIGLTAVAGTAADKDLSAPKSEKSTEARASGKAAGEHANMKSIADTAEHAAAHVVLTPDDIKWFDGPPSLPKGAKLAVLTGDPSKPGPFTIRGKMPAGYRIPAHTHPTDEKLTVISGILNLGMGDKLDTTKGFKMPAGSFASMPTGTRHYVWTEVETIIQVDSTGPFVINYVNPQDDPSKSTAMASVPPAMK